MIFILLGQILTRPAWLMAFFLLLACLIPFAGGTDPFRGDAFQLLDPFSFSLLSPSRRAFGPHSMLALTGLLIIPAVLIHWRRDESIFNEIENCTPFKTGILPLAALSLYCLFLLLCLPLIGRSTAFPGLAALGITILDLIILAAMMAWIVDFALSRTAHPRLQPLVGWIIAGGLHLARGMTDVFLIAPGTREVIEADWSTVTWHALLAIIAITLHALPLPSPQSRATL